MASQEQSRRDGPVRVLQGNRGWGGWTHNASTLSWAGTRVVTERSAVGGPGRNFLPTHLFSIPVPRPAEGTPIPNTHLLTQRPAWLRPAGGAVHTAGSSDPSTHGAQRLDRGQGHPGTHAVPSPSLSLHVPGHRCTVRQARPWPKCSPGPLWLGSLPDKTWPTLGTSLGAQSGCWERRDFPGGTSMGSLCRPHPTSPGAPTLVAGTDRDAPPRRYSQELLSPPLGLEVLEAQVSPGFQWAQQHRPDLSPPETPGVGGKMVHFQVHEYDFPLRSPSLQIPQQLPGPGAARATQTSVGFSRLLPSDDSKLRPSSSSSAAPLG